MEYLYRIKVEKLEYPSNNLVKYYSDESGDLNWIILNFITSSLPLFLKEIRHNCHIEYLKRDKE